MYIELRIAACASMLAIASILDIRSREIPDKLWLIFGSIGGILTLFELFDGLSANELATTDRSLVFTIHYVIGIAIISGIGYVIYKIGLFGGADSKALVAIAIILPVYGSNSTVHLHSFPAISVFSNALIVSMVAMVYNIARNCLSLARRIPIFDGMQESVARRALAFAVGFPSNSFRRYVFVMEEKNEYGQRKFRFNPANYDEFASSSEQQEHRDWATKRIWVTHALPFIVYISIGFIITLVVGDLMALLLRLL